MSSAEHSFENSNPIRLSPREWALTAVLCVGLLGLLPLLWPAAGGRLMRPDYRLPGELGSDYWMFRKWSQRASRNYPALTLGDSVVWGQYVRSADTLAHDLNGLLGGETFANLGVDGLHPAAMEGMVAYHGGAIRGKPVLVHLNPLWMSSLQQDLQDRAETRFNHPKLVPQLLHRPLSYQPPVPEVIAALLERQIPFFSWKEHLKIAYLEGLGWPEWSLENPYRVFPAERGPDSFAGDEPGSEPMTWRARGIAPGDLAWVEAKRSYQWQAFQRTLERLRTDGNSVFVVLGPFNTHALTEESRKRYEELLAAIEQWLGEAGILHYAPLQLPTDEYADVSHPLGGGYRAVAKDLIDSPAFRSWRESWSSGAGRPPDRK